MSKKFTSFLEKNKTLASILEAIAEAGGVPYLVGGSVRDMLLGFPPKDLDIEVHGLALDVLEKCLKKFGPVRLVGKQFGVLLVDGLDVDWSIPRRDSKGRKPKVELDPSMSIEEASRRRDLTINAMAIKLDQLEKVLLIDPYGGEEDLKNKVLRAVDEKLFCEDPLRFYRVMQFISRFEMHPDEELTKICEKVSLAGVAKERVFDELKKMLLKSQRPSLGIRWLKKIGRLKEIMPELEALIKTKQSPKYHPEGNAFEHSMQALDAGAAIEDYASQEEKLLIMLAAMCHDLGKAVTVDEELRTIGHEKEGVSLATAFLKRFSDDAFLKKAVGKLVRYHLMPIDLVKEDVKLSAYKRLAGKLAPELTIRHLGLVALCDILGRNPEGPWPLKEPREEHRGLCDLFIKRMQEAEVEHGAPEPVLKGRHIIDVVQPGEEMGELLGQAYEIQIEEGVSDIETLKSRVLKAYKREKD